jgi:hypothetical protein
MLSNVAFVSNGWRTATFKAVADRIDALGHEVFWITTGSKVLNNLIAPKYKYLDLSNISKADKACLSEFEGFSDISVNGIISSDRILSAIPESKARQYIASCYSKLNEYIKVNNISIVFGEATWAHEIVAAAVCRKNNIPYIVPVTMRYPSDRFMFFEGVFQNTPIDTGRIIDIVEGKRLYDEFISGGNVPFYMDLPKRNNVKMFLRHLKRHIVRDVYDYTVPSVWSLVRDKIADRINSMLSDVDALPDRPSGDYVYLPLHRSPEASVDILNGYCMDQVEFVRNVSRSLPAGLKLVVKEHPSQFRGRAFYKKLKSIPSVELINRHADSHVLIRGAKAVVSVSGTACYEAGLYGVSAFTFADMSYNELASVKKCTSYEDLYSVLKNVNNTEIQSGQAVAYLSKMLACSYKGFAESETVYADALNEQNISYITVGFIDIIKYYSSSKSATADSMCSRLI